MRALLFTPQGAIIIVALPCCYADYAALLSAITLTPLLFSPGKRRYAAVTADVYYAALDTL